VVGEVVVEVAIGEEERQAWMKSCRSGFIRCRGRDGPCGSHQEEARAEKWEISVSFTEEEVGDEGLW
jgi:hypothetical protein